jgi:transcriptional regulator with GAF, ATPase, and Fis domain
MSTELIGVSPQIIKIRKLIERIADTGINVIVCGETGVGKEVVVSQLYRKSDRCRKPFVKVNCAALPDTLLESEMFGYEQGAFTGAHKRMRGKFEQANGGVLFLDEIGDMSLPLQSKLLHSLQDGEFTRLGSEQVVKTDVWVIAATNRDLKKDVKKGAFRHDLYHRISTVAIHVEPLRNRPEDIAPLIAYYADKYSGLLNGRQYRPLSNSTIDKLVHHPWPGNVRQLQNVLKRLIILGDSEDAIDEMISTDEVDSSTYNAQKYKYYNWIDYFGLNNGGLSDPSAFSFKKIQKEARDIVDKEIISYALQKTGWNRSKAQRILDISYRTLLDKIQHLELQPPFELR